MINCWRITKNEFDSRYLGVSTGHLKNQFQDLSGIDPKSFKKEVDRYDLVCFKSYSINNLVNLGFSKVGTICFFKIKAEILMKKLSFVKSRFTCRQFKSSDNVEITRILETSPPTRFDNDPKIERTKVLSHKLENILDFSKKKTNTSVVIESPEAKCVGFHTATFCSNSLILKDIMIDPDYRNGFYPARLIWETLTEASKHFGDWNFEVTTGIYDTNLHSQRFFSSLGFQKQDITEQYYHRWRV